MTRPGCLALLLAAALASPAVAADRPGPPADAACSTQFAIVLFRVRGADGAPPVDVSASTRQLKSGTPVKAMAGIAGHGTVVLADDAMLQAFAAGDLELLTTLRRGDREYQVVHRVGLDPAGCHVMLKDGPKEFVLPD